MKDMNNKARIYKSKKLSFWPSSTVASTYRQKKYVRTLGLQKNVRTLGLYKRQTFAYMQQKKMSTVTVAVLRIRIRIRIRRIHVFGPPGSIRYQRHGYGSGSGSLYHQAKI